MKAKVILPDSTIVELEGDPIELAVLLPDMHKHEISFSGPVIVQEDITKKLDEVYGPNRNIPVTKWHYEYSKCECPSHWFGILPPYCPVHNPNNSGTVTCNDSGT